MGLQVKIIKGSSINLCVLLKCLVKHVRIMDNKAILILFVELKKSYTNENIGG